MFSTSRHVDLNMAFKHSRMQGLYDYTSSESDSDSMIVIEYGRGKERKGRYEASRREKEEEECCGEECCVPGVGCCSATNLIRQVLIFINCS